jgi:hypothetical protein
VAKKEKRERIVTPVGTGVFLAVLQPSKEYKNYVAVVAFDPKTDKAFLNKLQEMNKAAFEAEKKNAPPKVAKTLKPRTIIKKELDDQGDPTGRVIVTFKQKASHTTEDGKTYNFHVAAYDAKGKPLDPKTRIGAGTKLKVSFEHRATTFASGDTPNAGLSLQLAAVQILELVEWQAASAESFGFGEEEGYDGTTDAPSGDGDDAEEKDDAKDGEDEDGDPSAF